LLIAIAISPRFQMSLCHQAEAERQINSDAELVPRSHPVFQKPQALNNVPGLPHAPTK